MKLQHMIILKALRDEATASVFGMNVFVAFKPIQKKTGIEIKEVRRIVRHLARKGLAHFSAGLWTEDGYPAGSGYGITEKGLSELAKAEAKP